MSALLISQSGMTGLSLDRGSPNQSTHTGATSRIP